MNKRDTKQKRIIADSIKGRFHLTSEEIIEIVNKVDSSISRATIFRALNDLIADGKLVKVYLGKKVVYDNNVHEHDHFVCTKCGKVVDLMMQEKHNNPQGLYVITSSLTYYGICEDCLKKEKEL